MGHRENPNECFWNSINWTILQFLVQGRTVNADRDLICSTERVHCKTTIADVTQHPTDINQTTNQPTNQSIPNFLFKYLSTTPLCFQGETLKRLGLSNGGLLCSLNHGLWVKLFSRWHSPVWANIPKLSTIIILTIRNKTLMMLTVIMVHNDDDFWKMYGQPSFFHSDNQEKMVMLVKRGSRTAIYGQPLFFPSQRTQEPWLLINLIQFPPKWVTSRRPLLRPGTPDTISDRERVHLPYSTNCGDAPGILVIITVRWSRNWTGLR